MKKRILLSATIFVLSLLLVACQTTTETDEAAADEATIASCAKLGDFGTRLTEFGQELTQFDSPEEAAADEGVQQAMAEMDHPPYQTDKAGRSAPQAPRQRLRESQQ